MGSNQRVGRSREGSIPSCTVCFEEYNATNKLPRILPCHHTVCEICLAQLMQNGRRQRGISCPECRRQHSVTNQGVTQFQQNQYILEHLASLPRQDELCADHQRPLSMYCLNESCLRPVCQRCFLKGTHKGHNVTDTEEYREQCIRETKQKIEEIDQKVSDYKKSLVQEQKSLNDGAKNANMIIETTGLEMKKLIDMQIFQMKLHVSENFKNENERIQRQLQKIHELTKKLEDYRKRLVEFPNDVVNLRENIKSFKDDSGLTAMEISRMEVKAQSEEIDYFMKQCLAHFILETKSKKIHGIADLENKGKMWQIFLKCFDEKTHTIDIQPTDTIDALKQKIYVLRGIKPEAQLVGRFGGSTLRGKMSLRDNGLNDNCTLTLKMCSPSK